MAIIYKIENKVNHKVYIGQSMSTLEWRLNSQWIGHFPLAFERNSKMRVHKALRKYGKDNFTYEVIEERNDGTFEELHNWLDEREKHWISKYDSSNRLRGYNSTKGGQGCVGLHYKLSDEALATRKKTMQKNESSPSFKKWINNGVITKQVHYKEVDNYLKDGWVLGRLKMNKINPRKPVSQETRQKLSIAMKKDKTGRVYIYKGDVIKMIKPDKLQSYLDSGWFRGRGPSKTGASNGTETI